MFPLLIYDCASERYVRHPLARALENALLRRAPVVCIAAGLSGETIGHHTGTQPALNADAYFLALGRIRRFLEFGKTVLTLDSGSGRRRSRRTGGEQNSGDEHLRKFDRLHRLRFLFIYANRAVGHKSAAGSLVRARCISSGSEIAQMSGVFRRFVNPIKCHTL